MRSVVIDAGVVVNVIVGSVPGSVDITNLDPRPGIGWSYDGEVFTAPEPPPEPVPSIPGFVSPRQARLLLLGTDATDASANMLEQAEAIFDAMSEPQKTAAKIEWEYGTEVRRDSPLIDQLASTIGLTEQQIDAMFLAAAQL